MESSFAGMHASSMCAQGLGKGCVWQAITAHQLEKAATLAAKAYVATALHVLHSGLDVADRFGESSLHVNTRACARELACTHNTHMHSCARTQKHACTHTFICITYRVGSCVHLPRPRRILQTMRVSNVDSSTYTVIFEREAWGA